MRITEVKYAKKFNLGNYESEEFALTAVVEEKDNHLETLQSLKNDVHSAYSGDSKSAEDTETEEPDDTETEETESEDTESEESEEKTKPKAKSKKPKKFKSKAQAYDRANETHKEIFSSLLKSVAPDWKKTPESKVKAKIVSEKLEGEDFLDADGEVLPEFKASVKKAMGKK